MTDDDGRDAALLARAAKGDHDAFAELVDCHAAMVIAVCRRHVGGDAEDVAQEAFVKAWRASGSFAGRASVRTWLYRIAVNAARDALRRQQRRPQPADVDLTTIAERLADPTDLDEELAARGLDPAVRRGLAELPSAQREVVVLSDVLGLSHAEIAERHGVAPGTIKSRLHRGHARLAELLAGHEPGHGAPGEPGPPSDTSKPST